MSKIKKVISREIIDSRGFPTVETEVHLNNGYIGTASVPSGASTGSKEAIELRDNDKSRFFKKGVTKAVSIINNVISDAIHKKDACDQKTIDEIMITLDGTTNKSKLGSNSILSVSLAVSKAASKSQGISLYQHIANLHNTEKAFLMPLPMINIINGGKHANNNIDIQEFMIQPIKANTIKEAIQIGSEIFYNLGLILKRRGFSTTVGDEGGYAPNLKSNELIFLLLEEAIFQSKYQPGKDVTFCIDCAASELYNKKNKTYELTNEQKIFTAKEFTQYLEILTNKYPIISIEDGLDESDWTGFKYQTKKLGNKIQLVGDDLFVTNSNILTKGIKNNIANAILIKPNQIGTLTETLNTIKLAQNSNYNTIISHRSGETEDTTISDLAVGTNSGQIKTGSMCRSERVAKYNRLIRIEEKLGKETKIFKKNLSF